MARLLRDVVRATVTRVGQGTAERRGKKRSVDVVGAPGLGDLRASRQHKEKEERKKEKIDKRMRRDGRHGKRKKNPFHELS